MAIPPNHRTTPTIQAVPNRRCAIRRATASLLRSSAYPPLVSWHQLQQVTGQLPASSFLVDLMSQPPSGQHDGNVSTQTGTSNLGVPYVKVQLDGPG